MEGGRPRRGGAAHAHALRDGDVRYRLSNGRPPHSHVCRGVTGHARPGPHRRSDRPGRPRRRAISGTRRGTSRSASWACPSAHHAQSGRTPPVSIFRSGGGEERWHCHGCGIGGSAIDLVIVSRALTVAEAIEGLAGRAGIREPFVGDRRRPVAAARPARTTPARAPVADPVGLAAFVDECAERLWQPQGRVVLQWLTQVRGLPEEVLARNRIGADPGRHAQTRPDGMPSSGRAAVLPVYETGRPVFAQLRPISPPPDRPRYLNAASRLAATRGSATTSRLRRSVAA